MIDERTVTDSPETAVSQRDFVTNQLILAKLDTLSAKLDAFMAKQGQPLAAPIPTEGMPSPLLEATFNQMCRDRRLPRDVRSTMRARMFTWVAQKVPDAEIIKRLEGGESDELMAAHLAEISV